MAYTYQWYFGKSTDHFCSALGIIEIQGDKKRLNAMHRHGNKAR